MTYSPPLAEGKIQVRVTILPKEGDPCAACKAGILEYVRTDATHRELKCNNPKCPNSHEALRVVKAGKEPSKPLKPSPDPFATSAQIRSRER